MFWDVIGLNGSDNRNAKGKYLLFLLNSIKFRVLRTYFRHSNYTTRKYFKYTISTHMLEKIICSQPYLCRVKDFKVFNIGICSDHTAIKTTFKITAIKFKVTEKVIAHNGWKLIGYHSLTNELFNNRLSKSIAGGTTYSKYNKHTLEAGTNTKKINNKKNKGWLHFRRDSLLTLIKERDALLYDYLNLVSILPGFRNYLIPTKTGYRN